MAFRITKNSLYLKVETEAHYNYDDYSDVDTAYTTKYSWIDNEDEAEKYLSKSDAEDLLVKNWKKSFFKNAKIEFCNL